MEKLIWASAFQESKIKRLIPQAFTVSFIILFAFCQSCSFSRKEVSTNITAGNWKTEKQDGSTNPPGWTTFSRKKAGSKFKEFKITGIINVSPEKAIRVLREKTENSEKYISEKDGFIQVLKKAEDMMLVYSVYNLPFPFKGREMCERFLFFKINETGAQKIAGRKNGRLHRLRRKI